MQALNYSFIFAQMVLQWEALPPAPPPLSLIGLPYGIVFKLYSVARGGGGGSSRGGGGSGGSGGGGKPPSPLQRQQWKHHSHVALVTAHTEDAHGDLAPSSIKEWEEVCC